MSSKITINFGEHMPKPLYDPTNKNCIIISTHFQENKTTAGIYKYNTQTNESQIIYQYHYSYTFKPDGHGQFIDTSNNILILYGGWNDNTFKIFDLNTNQIKQINDKNIISKCGKWPQNTFFPSP
eukprot:549435_1